MSSRSAGHAGGGGAWRSWAPRSPMGAVPAPESATAGSSTNRGKPAWSTVVPTGTRAFEPLSMAGDPACRRKSRVA
ncbi:MAG: hypothetical protein LW636_04170 [Planctomycetaceae bacterium]|nr:hypothetical protein [Planctomycetaceae bacterium]